MVPALKIFEVISKISERNNLNLSDEQKHIIMVIAQVKYFGETLFPLFVNQIRGNGVLFTVQNMDQTSILPEFKMSIFKWKNIAIPVIKNSINKYISSSNNEIINFFNIENDSFIKNIVENHGFLSLSDISAIEKSHNPLYKL